MNKLYFKGIGGSQEIWQQNLCPQEFRDIFQISQKLLTLNSNFGSLKISSHFLAIFPVFFLVTLLIAPSLLCFLLHLPFACCIFQNLCCFALCNLVSNRLASNYQQSLCLGRILNACPASYLGNRPPIPSESSKLYPSRRGYRVQSVRILVSGQVFRPHDCPNNGSGTFSK